ncbi:MAG: cupin domain-containing protein [Phycisphaerae bacterium]|nr:cupin domain-containing protein [Phycisphaerae bacterium]
MSTPTFAPESKVRRITVIGDDMLVRITGRETGNTVSLFEQRTNPGGGVPMHVHDREDELFQVLSGNVEFTIGGANGTSFVAKPGDNVWGPRRVPHAWKVIGNEQARVLVIATPSGLEDMFEALSKLPPGPPDFAKVAEICGRFGVRFA